MGQASFSGGFPPSAVIDVSSGFQGEDLTITITGTGGATFTTSTTSCGDFVYEVDPAQNTDFYLISGVYQIFPTSVNADNTDAGTGSFTADFTFPDDAVIGDYDIVFLNTSGCATYDIVNPEVFTILSADPNFTISPNSASIGDTVVITYQGIQGARFTTNTASNSIVVYEVDPAQNQNVYLQSDTTTLYPLSVEASSDVFGNAIFTAKFHIPDTAQTGQHGGYDVWILSNDATPTTDLRILDGFTIQPAPHFVGEFWNEDNNFTFDRTPDAIINTKNVDFTWTGDDPHPDINDVFVSRFSGWVRPTVSGTYTFEVSSDDGFRLYVDDQSVIDSWFFQNTTLTGDIVLEANTYYNIRLEHFDGGGDAILSLSWAVNGGVQELVNLSSGLIAYYPMDGNANDTTGNYDGTVTGAVLTTDAFDRIDSAYLFDGDDQIDMGQMAVDFSNGLSFMGWFNMDSLIDDSRFFDLNGSEGRFYLKRYFNTDEIAYTYQGFDDLISEFGILEGLIDEWNHIAVTHDPDSTVRLYINGLSISDTKMPVPPTDVYTSAFLGANCCAGDYYSGKMDDIRFYNRSVDSVEVNNIYVLTRPPIPPTNATDSISLEFLYAANNGDNWDNNLYWTTHPVELWTGVTVENGRVTELDLFNNNVSGDIASQLSNLTELKKLVLRSNEVTSIPVIASLTYLDLGRNDLGTLPDFSQFPNLDSLFLDGTRLDSLPDFSVMPNLKYLTIGDNEFEDISALSGISNVTSIDISRSFVNDFSPLSSLTQLVAMNLTGNIIETYPDFSVLTNLNYLSLNNTETSVLPNLGSTIGNLNISTNRLEDISGLSSLTNLDTLNVRENNLAFDDLEPYFALDSIIYAPQRPVIVDNQILDAGASITMDFTTTGLALNYEWKFGDFQDSTMSETSNSVTIADFQAENAGLYTLNISSTFLPDLTISKQWRLEITPTIVNDYFDWIQTGDIATDLPQFSYGGTFVDYDNDGDVDLWSNHYLGANPLQNFFYENNGDGTFTKITSGQIANIFGGRASTWGDYNNDGFVDLLVPNNSEVYNQRGDLAIFNNNGDGTFTKIIVEFGDISNAVWTDHNNDGLLDIYRTSQSPGDTYVLLNNGDSTFTKDVEIGIDLRSSAWLSGVIDVNNDHEPDYIINDFNRNPLLYTNSGAGTFTEFELAQPAEGDNTIFAGGSWADWDNDGDIDLFMPRYFNSPSFIDGFVAINDGNGNFTKTDMSGVFGEEIVGRAGAFGDYDNDGFLDLVAHNRTDGRPQLYINNQNGTFTKVSESNQFFRSNAYFGGALNGDFDNDGFLDLYLPDASLERTNALYRNIGNSNNWLKVRLEGTLSNRSGIGARLVGHMGSVAMTRYVLSRTGWTSQNSLIQHFGLAANTTLDSLEIFWPSGTYQVLKDVSANQILDVAEPTGNVDPTDILLSAITVAENEAVGTAVGTLSTTDPNTGDTHTYTLVSGTGDTDNASFSITGDQLLTAESFNFESKSDYSIRIRSEDDFQGFREEEFIITIEDVNDIPNDIVPSDTTIDENLSSGAVVGTLVTTDDDAGDTFTYTLVAGTGDTDNSDFTISGDQLLNGGTFNFENKSSYQVRIQTEDSNGAVFARAFTILVNDLNEAPTAINLSSQTLNENEAGGFSVGTFSSVDEDSGDTHTYTFASTATEDTASFSISGSTLETNGPLSFEDQSSYTLLIESTDAGGLSIEQDLTVTIVDVDDAPSGLSRTSYSINDGNSIGDEVGTLVPVDDDLEANNNTNYEFTILPQGDFDKFIIQAGTNVLLANDVFDFEQKSSYQIDIRINDIRDLDGSSRDINILFTDVNVTIDILGAGAEPTDITLSANTIDEGEPVGTVIGTLSTVDASVSDSHIYSFVSGDTSAFSITGDQLLSDEIFDFEVKSSYSVTIRTTDLQENTFDKPLTISINDLNEAPTKVTLSNNKIQAGIEIITVGKLGSDDPDNEVLTYAFMAGEGDTNNDSFTIDGTDLKTTGEMNEGNYSIRVQATDRNQLTAEGAFNIEVVSIPVLPSDQPIGTTADNYTIIGIPVDQVSIQDVFGSAVLGDDFRLLSYTHPGPATDLTNSSQLRGGEGYWFITAVDQTDLILDSGDPVVLNDQLEFELSLDSGWNLIGNPFLGDVNWPSVISYNESQGYINAGDVLTVSGIYQYARGPYNLNTDLNEFEGGWVETDTDVTVRILSPNASGRMVNLSTQPRHESYWESDSQWQILIHLEDDELSSNLFGVGMHPEARIGRDVHDITIPPSIGKDIRFEMLTGPRLAKEIISPASDGEWNYEMNISRDQVVLRWDQSVTEKIENDLLMYFPVSDEAIDMKRHSHISVSPSQFKSLTIYYGENTPKDKLGIQAKAYPNPIQEMITFEFYVNGDQESGMVEIQIYTLSGLEFQTIRQSYPTGSWDRYEWDGSTLNSGVYFYRIKIGNRMSPLQKIIKR